MSLLFHLFGIKPQTRKRTLTHKKKSNVRSLLRKKQGGKCADGCGKQLRAGKYDIDHKKPLAMGGKDNIKNLQLLRKPCHKQKTQKERQKKI